MKKIIHGTEQYTWDSSQSLQSQENIAVAELKKQTDDQYGHGNYAEAKELYSKALAMDPSNSILLFNKELSCFKQSKWQASIDNASSSVALNDNYTKAWFLKGRANEKLGQNEQARICLNKTLELELEFDDALKMLPSSVETLLTTRGNIERIKWIINADLFVKALQESDLIVATACQVKDYSEAQASIKSCGYLFRN